MKPLRRTFDVLAAAAGLIVLAPLLAVIAIAIRLSMHGAALFRQIRTGLGGKTFELIKFRTMSDERDAGGQLLPDAQRMTRVGSFLRRTSLDELPQLWNILRGDMSLVGPRPLLPQYLPLYSQEQSRRHDVKPGLTGWAQVNGRNALSWEEKFRLDVWYVEHQSLSLDLRILLLTIRKVFGQHGIDQRAGTTMDPFAGSPRPATASPITPFDTDEDEWIIAH